MPKASDVLQEAIEILKPKGHWCTGELHEFSDGKYETNDENAPRAHCAVGGINAVTHGVKLQETQIYDYDSMSYTTGWYLLENDFPRKGYIKADVLAKKYLAQEAKKLLKKNGWSDDRLNDLTSEDEWGNDELVGYENLIIEMNDSKEIGGQKVVLAAFKRALKKALADGN